ncbi:MAG: hypothetical protein ACI915_002240 [Gammaproteobacteria bacterium]|jgi:hypothetical protein
MGIAIIEGCPVDELGACAAWVRTFFRLVLNCRKSKVFDLQESSIRADPISPIATVKFVAPS